MFGLEIWNSARSLVLEMLGLEIWNTGDDMILKTKPCRDIFYFKKLKILKVYSNSTGIPE
jgi:hypothetical protein